MPLETGEFISDLNPVNPVGATDFKSQGDDHLRLLKKTVQQSWPNINAAVTLTPTQLNVLTDASLKAANETIGGDKTFTGANVFSGTYDGIAGGDLLDKTAPETISGAYLFTEAGGIRIANSAPLLFLEETEASADEGKWRALAFGNALLIQTLDDSEAVPATVMSVERTAEVVDQITLGGPLLVNGALLATAFAGIASANLLSRIVAEDVSGGWRFTGNLEVKASDVRQWFSEDAGPADERDWLFQANGNQLSYATANDARSAFDTWLAVQRTGINVDLVTYTADALHLAGALTTLDASAASKKVGFRNPTWRTVGGSFSVAQSDEATIMQLTGGVQQVTLDTLEANTTFRCIKNTASNATFVKGTLTTLILAQPGAIPQTVTSITLVPGGVAEVAYQTGGIAYVFGSGLVGVP